MAVEIYMPKMSDHMLTGRVVRWYAKEGDLVQRGQILLELETDKAVGEIEAPESGILRGVQANEGDDVTVGGTIAYIAAPDEVLKPSPAAISSNIDAPKENGINAETINIQPNPAEQAEKRPIFATPVARKMAKNRGLDLTLIKGTGPNGRIKREDVEAYLEKERTQVDTAIDETPKVATQSIPPAVRAEASNGDSIHLTTIQRITGQRMLESVTTAPHFFLEVKVDMTRALELIETASQRAQALGEARISITALLVRVVGAALKKYPRVNAAYEEGQLRKAPEINIGVAVGTDQGLAVPVIRNADKKILAEINQELKAIQAKGKEMRFSPVDLEGGTFTISNLGMYGVDVFQAIINPPQSAILAVGRVAKMPVAMADDTVAVRPMMHLTLSVDHRVLDGIQGAQFLNGVKELLTDPSLLV